MNDANAMACRINHLALAAASGGAAAHCAHAAPDAVAPCNTEMLKAFNCTLYSSTCSGISGYQAYSDCTGTVSANGANGMACRTQHLSLAAVASGAATHCPHAQSNATGPCASQSLKAAGGTTTGTTSTTGTTGGTTASTKVEGSVTVVAAGVTKAQVEAASKTALAEHFAVASSRLTTTATETRRLGVDGNDRRLKGTWTIAYNFLALPAEVTSINTKVATATSAPAAFKAALATKFKAGLKKAGVDATVADALVVSSATSVATTTSATTGVATSGTSSAKLQALSVLSLCALLRAMVSDA